MYATIGAKLYALPPVFTQDSFEVGGATISRMDLFAFGFSVVAIGVLHFVLTHTKVGTAIRAASYDMEMVSVLGVNLDVLVAVLFLIAGGLGGMAGVFMGVKYMVYPSMGWITNKAYIGAVIGGLGSLPGAIVGGILLGLLEALVSVTTIGSVHLSTYRDVFSFGILVILLIVRPTGLFGRTSKRSCRRQAWNTRKRSSPMRPSTSSRRWAWPSSPATPGLFSLGHAAFMAVGAYTAAILTYFLPLAVDAGPAGGHGRGRAGQRGRRLPHPARQAALRLFRHRHAGFRRGGQGPPREPGPHPGRARAARHPKTGRTRSTRPS